MVNFKVVLILLLSLAPPLSYLLLYRRLKRQWEARLERARWMNNSNYRENFSDFYPLEAELELSPSYIGDASCIYNAHSPYLRCAVNPCGSCQNCPYYQSR